MQCLPLNTVIFCTFLHPFRNSLLYNVPTDITQHLLYNIYTHSIFSAFLQHVTVFSSIYIHFLRIFYQKNDIFEEKQVPFDLVPNKRSTSRYEVSLRWKNRQKPCKYAYFLPTFFDNNLSFYVSKTYRKSWAKIPYFSFFFIFTGTYYHISIISYFIYLFYQM